MHDDGIQQFRAHLKMLANLPYSSVGCENCRRLMTIHATQQQMQDFLDEHRKLGHVVWIEREPG